MNRRNYLIPYFPETDIYGNILSTFNKRGSGGSRVNTDYRPSLPTENPAFNMEDYLATGDTSTLPYKDRKGFARLFLGSNTGDARNRAFLDWDMQRKASKFDEAEMSDYNTQLEIEKARAVAQNAIALRQAAEEKERSEIGRQLFTTLTNRGGYSSIPGTGGSYADIARAFGVNYGDTWGAQGAPMAMSFNALNLQENKNKLLAAQGKEQFIPDLTNIEGRTSLNNAQTGLLGSQAKLQFSQSPMFSSLVEQNLYKELSPDIHVRQGEDIYSPYANMRFSGSRIEPTTIGTKKNPIWDSRNKQVAYSEEPIQGHRFVPGSSSRWGTDIPRETVNPNPPINRAPFKAAEIPEVKSEQYQMPTTLGAPSFQVPRFTVEDAIKAYVKPSTNDIPFTGMPKTNFNTGNEIIITIQGKRVKVNTITGDMTPID